MGRRRTAWVGAIVAVALVAVPAAPATAATRSALVVRAMKQTAHQYRHQILGLCLGALDDRVRRIRCYGKVGPGSHRAPNADTLFGIASITKTFTATLLAADVARGQIGLRAPVRGFVPPEDGPDRYPPGVTLRGLAQHYSGLPRDPAKDTIYNLDDLFTQTGACYASTADPPCLLSPPGTKMQYSNWGFELLGIILGRHDGFAPETLPDGNVLPPWEPALRARVLDPLGLRHTSTFVGFDQRGQLGYYRAHVATPVLGDGTVWNPPLQNGAPTIDGAGGLISSSRDMMTWLRYSMSGRAPGPLHSGFPLLYRRPAVNRPGGLGKIGLAWNITAGSGSTIVNKDGTLPGYESFMSFVQGKPRGVFVLVNHRPAPYDAPDIACTLMRRLPPADATLPCPAAQDPRYPVNTVVEPATGG